MTHTQNLIWNSFLPEGIYMPDGEPHVFNDRIYLFGSHDKEGGETYCMLPYEFYSAPVDDLTKWTSNGISYRADQDPLYNEKRCYMYAPDVVQGNDKRFYLYYQLAGYRGVGGYFGPISVAVSDRPDGPYEYLGFVRNADGTPHNEIVTFDPAVINDNGTIRLYYGTLYPYDEWKEMKEKDGKIFVDKAQAETIKADDFDVTLVDKLEMEMFGRTKEQLEAARTKYGSVMGPVTVTLAEDMLTVTSDIKRITPYKTYGTEWQEHPFYEGSSIRKIGDTYYFIYSSLLNHELCYATSLYPDRDFKFRGTIISTGDIGLNGRKAKDRLNATGTTHGSIEKIKDKWYVFYHRVTHGTDYSRQALAEEIKIKEDGSIKQVEITSQGLNGKPLLAKGEYPAGAACIITNGNMPHGSNSEIKEMIPMLINEDEDRFITNISDGTWVGYRYFDIKDDTDLSVEIRVDKRELYSESKTEGKLESKIEIYDAMDGEVLGSEMVSDINDWHWMNIKTGLKIGKRAIFIKYSGDGFISIRNIRFT